MILNNNQYKSIKPYWARNMLIQQQPETEQQPSSNEVGYIDVGVFTASGALPVNNAVVTVYHTYDNGEEHIFYRLVTDESGRVPTMEVPVKYSGIGNPPESYYSTYNLRVQAVGYYTVNVIDIRVFPNITTVYRINLIPAAHGITETPEYTIVIPKIPAESTNP